MAGRFRGLFQAQRLNDAGVYVPAPNPVIRLNKKDTSTPVTQTIWKNRTGTDPVLDVYTNPFTGDVNGNAEWFFDYPERVSGTFTIPGQGIGTFETEDVHGDSAETVVTTPDVAPTNTKSGLGQMFIDPTTKRQMWLLGNGRAVPVDHLPVTNVDDAWSTMVTAGEREYQALKVARDRALARQIAYSAPASILQLSDREHIPHRAFPAQGLSNFWLRGGGANATLWKPDSKINGGAAGAPLDPMYNNVIDATNGNVTPHLQAVGISDFTIDMSNIRAFAGLDYNLFIGWEGAGFSIQQTDRAFVHRMRFVRCPTGCTIGSVIPALVGAIVGGEIHDSLFEDCACGVMRHYKWDLESAPAPAGIAAQMGYAIGGSILRNTFRNCSGPGYAIVGGKGTLVADNFFEGYGLRVAVLGGSVSGINGDFGMNQCIVRNNVMLNAGHVILNGRVKPTVLNGMVSEPAAVESEFDIMIEGTAMEPYPSPPALGSVNGQWVQNNTGRDAAMIFTDVGAGGTVVNIQVGEREDGSQNVTSPNIIRHVVVENGDWIKPAVTGTMKWDWYLARNRVTGGSMPAPPTTSPFNYTNGLGYPVIVQLIPTATIGGNPVIALSNPLLAGIVFQIDGMTVSPMGIRRSEFLLPAGATFHMEWDATANAVRDALRAYYDPNYPGNVNPMTLLHTGWVWRFETLLAYTGPEAALGSGVVAYNPLGMPALVDVTDGLLTGLTVFNSAGGTSQNGPVISARTGRQMFIVDAGGSFLPTYTDPNTEFTMYAAPNALFEHFHGDSGSIDTTKGFAKNNRIKGKSVRAPFAGVLLKDFPDANLNGLEVIDAGEGRGLYSVHALDSNVDDGNVLTDPGVGCPGLTLDGATLMETRVPAAEQSHVVLGASPSGNTKGVRIRAKMTATTGATVLNGGAAGTVDSTGSWGSGVPINPDGGAAFAVTSGAAINNPYTYKATLYLIGTGVLSDVTLGGISLGVQTRVDVRPGGSVVATFTGTLTGRWVPA